jgi:hypothetical protein
MGTITRSFANNITTSGVLLPASLTNASIANVTAYNASVATGGMVLVSSATASASATIDFTLGSYKEYQFYFVNIHPATDGVQFQFNMSIDSGSNYNVAKTTTSFRAIHTESDSTALLGYHADHDLAQGTGHQHLTNPIGNENDESCAGYLHLFSPSSTTFVKHFISRCCGVQETPFAHDFYVAGYGNTTSALTNIRFQMSSGNIDEGTILMYGIV